MDDFYIRNIKSEIKTISISKYLEKVFKILLEEHFLPEAWSGAILLTTFYLIDGLCRNETRMLSKELAFAVVCLISKFENEIGLIPGDFPDKYFIGIKEKEIEIFTMIGFRIPILKHDDEFYSLIYNHKYLFGRKGFWGICLRLVFLGVFPRNFFKSYFSKKLNFYNFEEKIKHHA